MGTSEHSFLHRDEISDTRHRGSGRGKEDVTITVKRTITDHFPFQSELNVLINLNGTRIHRVKSFQSGLKFNNEKLKICCTQNGLVFKLC